MTKSSDNPLLRFPEFENSWIEKKIKDLGNFIGGGTPSSNVKEFWQGNTPWISSSDIEEESIHVINKSRFITPEAIENSATKLVPLGSILMVSRVGIGKFAVADCELCTSQDFTSLITDQSEYFLAYYFKARSNRFIRLSQGTSIKGFTTTDIKSATFSIPSLPEQQKIASFLTAIDQRIQLLEKKKAKLEEYKKGVMQKLFSQEIRFKDDDGKEFPDWEEKKLGSLCRKAQSGGTPKSTNKNYYNGNIPFLSISDMTSQGKFLTETSKSISKEGLENSSAWIVPKNSLIYSMYASVGFVSINKIPIATSQAVMNIILKKDYELEYIYYYLTFFRARIHRFVETGTQGNINAQIVKDLKIPIPIAEEQKKISSFLSSIDKSIWMIKNEIDGNKKFKKGLLQKMFV